MLTTLALLALLPGLPPLATSVAPLWVVRSHMLPLARVGPDGALLPHGPMSPRGFGRETGRLRHLATSDVAGVSVVEVADAAGGAVFALPLAAPGSAAPIHLADTMGVGFDVAISPDGRRLLYIDGHHPTVVGLTPPYGRPVVVTPVALARAALPPDLADMRVEGARWLDDRTIAFEVETYHRRQNAISTTIEAAPADGSEPARRLVTPTGAQDRLAATLGDAVFFYRDGVLHRAVPGGLAEPQRLDTGVVGVVGQLLVATRGESGVERTIGLVTLDATGREQQLVAPRKAWLDPHPTPDGQALLLSVRVAGGWIVERIALDGSTRALTPPAPEPIELTRFVPGSTLIAGCRGDAVVVLDHARHATPRVLTRAPGNPSCTIRGATTTAVVFERRHDNGWRVELLPTSGAGGGPHAALANVSVAAVSGDAVIVQTGFEGVAKIAGQGLGREVTLVPWQREDIADARRSPDGRTVVFRVGDRSKAVRLDRPGVVVELTGPHPDAMVVGLTDDRLVGWDSAGRRFVSWRLDGRDAGRPATVLGGVAQPGPYAHAHRRVVGVRADGTIVSAPVDGSAPPVVVLRGASWGSLGYDAAHGRIVAPTFSQGPLTIVSASVGGEDVDQPRVLGAPRPRQGTSLHHIEVLPSGNVQIDYATSTTAVPHHAGSDVLASNGSGYRAATPARGSTRTLDPFAAHTPPGQDPSSGAELRTRID